jgi:hybrid cluster-associated redox disulfide protein
MPTKPSNDPDLSLDRLMRDWPGTVAVFVKHRMLCVGCPIGPFHTVSDACREHSIDEETFRRELQLSTGSRWAAAVPGPR